MTAGIRTSWQLNLDSPETYAYDSAGRLDQKDSLDLEYNDAAHVHAVTDTNSNSYDVVGNILSIADSINSQTQNFEYDDLDLLWHASATGTEAQGGYAQETYTYSTTTGNLESKAGVTYTYDSGHAHAVSSLSNGNTYTYDANGNGTLDGEEKGAPVEVAISQDVSCPPSSREIISAVTVDLNGVAIFSGLKPGKYCLHRFDNYAMTTDLLTH